MTKDLFTKKYPDYHSRLRALRTLIDKRGDYTANLNKEEREEYEALWEWYYDNHRTLWAL